MESFKERIKSFYESTAGKVALGVTVGLVAVVMLFSLLGMRNGLENEETAAGLEAAEIVATQSESAKRNLAGGIVTDIDWDTVQGYDGDGNPVYGTMRTVPTVGGYDMCGAPITPDTLIVTGRTDEGVNVFGNYSAITKARERGINGNPNSDIEWNVTAGYDEDNNPLLLSKDKKVLCYDLLGNGLQEKSVLVKAWNDGGLPIYAYSTIQAVKADGKNGQKALEDVEFTDVTGEAGGKVVLDSDMGIKVKEVPADKPKISVNKVDALPGEQGAPKSVGSTMVGEKDSKDAGDSTGSVKTAEANKNSTAGSSSTSTSSSGSSTGSSSSKNSSGSTDSGSSSSSSSSSGSSGGLTTSDSKSTVSTTTDSKRKYTVTFEPDNGKKVTTVDVEDGEAVTRPSDPQKSGYVFDGWYSGEDKFSFSTKIKKNITLTAHWKRDTYKVIFDWNKPEAMTAAQERNSYFSFPDAETFYAEYGKTYGESSGDFPEISESIDVYGYHFNGWYTGTTLVTADTDVMEKAITLKASWKPITYKITYQKGTDTKGSVPSGDMNISYVATYTVADTLTVPDPTLEGYVFTGWTYGTASTPVKSLIFNMGTTGDLNLVAHWTGNTITVIYDSNGGSGSMKNSSITYSNNAYLSLCEFKRNGYVFVGWNTAKDGSGTWYTSNNGLIAADAELFSKTGATVTLYAQWKAVSYNVAFAGNNATDGDMAVQSFTYGTSQALNPVAYSKTGYTFAGWALTATGTVVYKDKAQVNNLTETDGETVTLFARWTPITYTVSFEINAGTQTGHSTQKLTYDKEEQLTANTFNYTGHEFKGWGTDPNQYYITFADKDMVLNLCSESNDTYTLYALWKRGTYALTFDPGTGATVNTASKMVVFGEEYGKLPEPEKDGYTFEGWFTSSGSSGEQVFSTTTMDKEGAKVYAHWTRN